MRNSIRIFMLGAVIAVAGCHSGGRRPQTAAEIFVSNLNYEDVYNTYYLAKDPTFQFGYIVVQVAGGGYRAIDIQSLLRWEYSYDVDYFFDNSFSVWYTGGGYYQDILGNYYADSSGSSKDLEKVGAIIEKARVKDIGEQLAANYGLSESRGVSAAKLLVDWKKLQKKRSLTDADANAFSEKLLGFSVTKALSAAEKADKGDKTDMDKLINDAAKTNETSPEHLRELFKDVLNN